MNAEPCFERTLLIVMDSVGIGELPDAVSYGDRGSDTLGNIAKRIPLKLPSLRALGLGRVAAIGPAGTARPPVHSKPAAVGRMAEASAGKDSVTGHWEMMGIVLDRAFPTFPNGFPAEIVAAFSAETGRGVLGNKAASGTAIIDELGAEHMRTGSLIVYTSADSVFQIAAHEDVVPVAELYRACAIAYRIAAEGLGVGRVIARPFVGRPGAFKRTANRRDFALPPSDETLLDRLKAASLPVVAIGKVEDLFAGRGITTAFHTKSDDDGMNELERQMTQVDRGLIFTNLVDFDSQYGHRNDAMGYADNLERFDARLGMLLPQLKDDDLLIVTADHGNDPTTASTDHSREYVPLIAAGSRVRAGADLGTRQTFSDLAQTLAELFGVGRMRHGSSFLRDLVTVR
jgi:phosphopentomutase